MYKSEFFSLLFLKNIENAGMERHRISKVSNEKDTYESIERQSSSSIRAFLSYPFTTTGIKCKYVSFETSTHVKDVVCFRENEDTVFSHCSRLGGGLCGGDVLSLEAGDRIIAPT